MSRVTRLVVFAAAAIALAACGGAQRDEAGEIVEGGTQSAFDLEVGDCFNDPEDFSEISSVEAVPCNEQHDNEVYFLAIMPQEEFPGTEATETWAEDACLSEFQTYVGIAQEESALQVGSLYPTEASWEGGDREVVCILYDADLAPLTGSMRSASR